MNDDKCVTRREMKTELKLRDRAGKLQTKELARRLDALNHEHERSQETAQTYVTIAKFDDAAKADKLVHDLLLADVTDLKNFKSKTLGFIAIGGPLLLLVGGIAGRLIAG